MTAMWPIDQKRLEAYLQAVMFARQRAADLVYEGFGEDGQEWLDVAELLRHEGGLTERNTP